MTHTEEQQSTDLSADILSWVEESLGGKITYADRQPGGGRREAWYVDVETPDGQVRELFLRYDRTDREAAGDPFTLQDEAKYFLALQDSAVPVPKIYAVHPVEQAIVSSRVPGKAWFSQLRDEEQRLAIAREFMTILAGLHAVDLHGVDLPGDRTDPDRDLRDVVVDEIERWTELYRAGVAPADPLIELGLVWLRKNVPDVAGPVVLVQGDTGPGNFLYEDGRVTAVLDWELAHLGDPHDDLAWLTVRAVQEPFTHMPDRLRDYAAASGREIDLDRIRYYRVFAELRILILGHNKVGNASPLSEIGNSLIYGALHRRLFIEAMADVLGLTLSTPEAIEAPATSQEWLYDAALAQISQIIVPRSEDPFVIQRSKGLARILKYLREADRLADPAASRDLDDLESVLGSRPGSVVEGSAALVRALSDDTIDAAAAVAFFQSQSIRQTQIMRPAMGVLADRHFDPLS
ncbi:MULTISPECIES: phosphotransferase family protein [Aeromicrobium]|uniref:phosphotransferase family protein n=1 Tax=Aeromicrobium TaxID=2040 RepID=UPI00188EF93B|nr:MULTISPECIES: phosphotransferase family protein [Aeromicrobium]